MSKIEDHEPADRSLESAELALIAALSPDRIQAMDAALLTAADARWRKVAFLVACSMTGPAHVVGVPDAYYAQRVRQLVADGALESRGSLSRMRYSEVRLPGRVTTAES
ncbi:DUF3658 domain-containing protein [Marilutibacter chinensis]|uniref:DUF3658 domain-containing protein n=1 Tax=Marilutibacter chinensis TaxID=2912247 RepID=A0ABS9HUM7_9GAMM|nr:DUF3658 domain-containing protein [Lysobacter chinensis]MCF7222591.1 DUF3658 domain-containing protein [Lysobacter chinensis]